MKKILLMTAAFVAVSTASFAQVQRAELGNHHNLKFDKKMVRPIDKKVFNLTPTAAPFKANSRRAFEDNVWYSRPEGTYYFATQDASENDVTLLVVPSFTDIKFYNRMPDETYKEASWLFNGTDLSQYNRTDENNNLTWNFEKGMAYSPTLSSKGIDFKLTDYVMATDSFPIAMQPFNYNKSPRYWGGMDEAGNPFSPFGVPEVIDFDFDGDGNKENARISSYGQVYEKPATALYLYEISTFISAPQNPLLNGKKLTAKICHLQKNPDGTLATTASGRYVPGEVIAELEADENSVEMITSQSIGGKLYPGVMWFSNYVTDEFGNPKQEPVVIDDAFMVLIEGLDQEGLTINFHFCNLGDDMCELYNSAQPAYMYYTDTQTGQPTSRSVSYYGKDGDTYYCYALGLSFSAEMDAVDIPELFAELKVGAEGGDVAADYTYQEQTVKVPLYVRSVFPFVERDGQDLYLTDNYSFVGMPEWVELASVDDTYFEYPGEAGDGSDAVRGETHLYFTAQALPAGQTGRAARVWIKSKRGVVSEKPFYVLQGDATVADGIAAIKFDAKGKFVGTYNLGGARVSENAKGLIIKDGKKLLKK